MKIMSQSGLTLFLLLNTVKLEALKTHCLSPTNLILFSKNTRSLNRRKMMNLKPTPLKFKNNKKSTTNSKALKIEKLICLTINLKKSDLKLES